VIPVSNEPHRIAHVMEPMKSGSWGCTPLFRRLIREESQRDSLSVLPVVNVLNEIEVGFQVRSLFHQAGERADLVFEYFGVEFGEVGDPRNSLNKKVIVCPFDSGFPAMSDDITDHDGMGGVSKTIATLLEGYILVAR